MSKTVTLGQLRTRARQLANMDSTPSTDTLCGDTEVDGYINTHLSDLYDVLAAAAPEGYYSSDVEFNTTAGTISYALANVGLTDFRSLQRIFLKVSADQRLPLTTIVDADRGGYRAPQGAYTVVVRYTPALTDLANTNSTFDGVSGWDELVVALAARDMLIKEESDITGVEVKIQDLRQRLDAYANKRDQGEPPRMRRAAGLTTPFPQSLHGYQLRAGYIDLYSISPCLWPVAL